MLAGMRQGVPALTRKGNARPASWPAFLAASSWKAVPACVVLGTFTSDVEAVVARFARSQARYL